MSGKGHRNAHVVHERAPPTSIQVFASVMLVPSVDGGSSASEGWYLPFCLHTHLPISPLTGYA